MATKYGGFTEHQRKSDAELYNKIGTRKKFYGKTYTRYKTANTAPSRDSAVKMAKRRYEKVYVFKPNLYGAVKYIIYVREKKKD